MLNIIKFHLFNVEYCFQTLKKHKISMNFMINKNVLMRQEIRLMRFPMKNENILSLFYIS